LNVERLFEGDDQFHGVQAIGAKIVDQQCFRDDHNRINAKMATDDQDNLRGDVGQTLSLLGWSNGTRDIRMPQRLLHCAATWPGATATRSPAGHDVVERGSAQPTLAQLVAAASAIPAALAQDGSPSYRVS